MNKYKFPYALAIALATLAFSLWSPGSTGQIDPDDLLPVEQAFDLSAELSPDQRSVRLKWEIAEGYYLYRHAFDFQALNEGLELGEPEIAAGKAYQDEFFGDVEVYRGQASVVVPIEKHPASGPIALQVGSQGCADLGICYPPQRTEVRLAAEPAVPPTRGDSTSDPEPASARSGVLDSLDDFASSGALTGRTDPLPPEQAFGAEVIALGPGELLARFSVHPGYYLYRDTIEFSSADPEISVTGMRLPAARAITDEYFGDAFAYFGEVEIPISLTRPAGGPRDLEVTARFQGCQSDGICYPPMERTIDVALPAAPATAGAEDGGALSTSTATQDADGGATPAPATESDQDRLARFITEQSLVVTMALFVLLGIGLAFTPCVFPMIPILSGIIAGEGDDVTRRRAFSLSLAYVLAMALTYTAVGVIAALMGYNLQAAFQNPWILSVFALIFVLLALAMFGFYNLQLPASWQARLSEVSNRQSGGNLLGAGIMGFFSALIVGPCVTAPLIGILIFISQTGDALLGGSVLFALSIGMGVPLLAIGIGMGHWLPRAGAWMDGVKAVFGVGLLALAIWMLARILPGGVTMLLWGALAVGSGVFLGALTRLEPDAGGWRKLWQAMGVIVLAFGIMQFVGAAGGGNDWLRPLQPYSGGGGAGGSVEQPQFVSVDNLAELQRAVAAAGQPVFLDFYADWCVDCKRMERRTFPDPGVAGAMAQFDLIKIDMTAFDEDDQKVLNEFDLHGPPAYLFFHDGKELERFRMYGFMAPEKFLDHLQQVRQVARQAGP